VAIDPKDLGELQKALNEAAGKASVLWTTFITFQLYLAIAFGSVTHRDLFLENSIKLPLLNVDLPLVGFFVVAPAVLVILHFYVFLQLLGLAITAKDYNALLAMTCPMCLTASTSGGDWMCFRSCGSWPVHRISEWASSVSRCGSSHGLHWSQRQCSFCCKPR
jgi:hypothetical protein